MMDFFAPPSRKRGRDETDGDEYGNGVLMEGVPLEKRQRNNFADIAFVKRDIRPVISRSRTLPFRIEHPQAPPLPPPAYEPSTDAESPSNTDPSGCNSPASFMSLPAPADSPDADMGMGMADEVTIVGSASPPSPYQTQTWLRPAKLNSPGLHDQFSGGRIPTPIHSNFLIGAPPPPRAGTWAAADSSSGSISETMLAPPRQRPHLATADYRIPSPISEDYIDTPTDITSSQLSRLSFTGDDNMELDAAPPIDPVPDTPTRTGRARSGAISTISGGLEKKKFVVGYREDCEKCRARMPGHWAHFLPI